MREITRASDQAFVDPIQPGERTASRRANTTKTAEGAWTQNDLGGLEFYDPDNDQTAPSVRITQDDRGGPGTWSGKVYKNVSEPRPMAEKQGFGHQDDALMWAIPHVNQSYQEQGLKPPLHYYRSNPNYSPTQDSMSVEPKSSPDEKSPYSWLGSREADTKDFEGWAGDPEDYSHWPDYPPSPNQGLDERSVNDEIENYKDQWENPDSSGDSVPWQFEMEPYENDYILNDSPPNPYNGQSSFKQKEPGPDVTHVWDEQGNDWYRHQEPLEYDHKSLNPHSPDDPEYDSYDPTSVYYDSDHQWADHPDLEQADQKGTWHWMGEQYGPLSWAEDDDDTHFASVRQSDNTDWKNLDWSDHGLSNDEIEDQSWKCPRCEHGVQRPYIDEPDEYWCDTCNSSMSQNDKDWYSEYNGEESGASSEESLLSEHPEDDWRGGDNSRQKTDRGPSPYSWLAKRRPKMSSGNWVQDFPDDDGTPVWTYLSDEETDDPYFAHITGHPEGPFTWSTGEAGPWGGEKENGTENDFSAAQRAAEDSHSRNQVDPDVGWGYDSSPDFGWGDSDK